MRIGRAARNRACASMSRRNEILPTLPPVVLSAERTSNGNHVSRTDAIIRRSTNSRASPSRCALRRSWKSGPPKTKEKLSASPPWYASVKAFRFGTEVASICRLGCWECQDQHSLANHIRLVPGLNRIRVRLVLRCVSLNLTCSSLPRENRHYGHILRSFLSGRAHHADIP